MGAQGEEATAGKRQKASREVYFAVLPDRYEPLVEEVEEEEEEDRRERKEEKRRRKKKKYKKYRKNLGKALRFSWRCLMLGLQNMASASSTPLAVATQVSRAAGGKA